MRVSYSSSSKPATKTSPASKPAYNAANIRAMVDPFFKNLPEEIAKANLVIGRAGASTAAELTVMGRPSILVPLPHALDNDQLNNARRLAEVGGCRVLEQKDLTTETLAGEIHLLLTDPDVTRHSRRQRQSRWQTRRRPPPRRPRRRAGDKALDRKSRIPSPRPSTGRGLERGAG